MSSAWRAMWRAAVMRVDPVQRRLGPEDVRRRVLELDRQRLDQLDLGQVVALEQLGSRTGMSCSAGMRTPWLLIARYWSRI